MCDNLEVIGEDKKNERQMDKDKVYGKCSRVHKAKSKRKRYVYIGVYKIPT